MKMRKVLGNVRWILARLIYPSPPEHKRHPCAICVVIGDSERLRCTETVCLPLRLLKIAGVELTSTGCAVPGDAPIDKKGGEVEDLPWRVACWEGKDRVQFRDRSNRMKGGSCVGGLRKGRGWRHERPGGEDRAQHVTCSTFGSDLAGVTVRRDS